jgi:hypothetical protein
MRSALRRRRRNRASRVAPFAQARRSARARHALFGGELIRRFRPSVHSLAIGNDLQHLAGDERELAPTFLR